MTRFGIVCLLATCLAGPVGAQQAYRHVLADGRVVYSDTPPGMTSATSGPAQPEWLSTAPAAQDARARAPESARPSDGFGAGARQIVSPQEVGR